MTALSLPIQTKHCQKCDTDLPLEAFGRLRKSKDGLNPLCKKCARGYFQTYRDENAEKLKKYHRDYRKTNATAVRAATHNWKVKTHGSPVAAARFYKFKITQSQFEVMIEQQNGVCAICKRPETQKQNGKLKSLVIDHNHETGAIRQLLCHTCNRVLGLMGENPERLRQAANYLEKHDES